MARTWRRAGRVAYTRQAFVGGLAGRRRPRAGEGRSAIDSEEAQTTTRISQESVYNSSSLSPPSKESGGPPHLVLEELPEGLYQPELQVLGQPADVVVRLDGVGVLLAAAGGRAGLDDVGVEGALGGVWGGGGRS
jgi:hypothetical protein